ncbi:hypothetical protein A2Z33_07155 [Candidatus Gottesmanbacteria bacterium RBG_16_52_11]|uniref:DUF4446 domain-containing protein n=1 Tax=Candidatus Gottesmanbacteria bacterium RBG_16_52_11 TaxID=1798374 RepID=A0A1F5YYQ2_9BACT|nr:MAG: hypothetical protein A2Z33_07155 [Candidatus Gottesmanbacteria bacterium RBG_16_52_11]
MFNISLIGLFVVSGLVIWLIVISVKLFHLAAHYHRLATGTGKTSIQDVLNVLLDRQKQAGNSLSELEKRLEKIRSDSTLHIQKAGVVRFNPFSDTGGSQSFTLALLDALDNGIVMTSLYARTGNRWYIKHVHGGKGVELELSKEEKVAIQKARYVSELSP